MKRPGLVLLCALVVGLLAFGITRWLSQPAIAPDEIAWMRDEFNLTPDQVAAIKQLHDDYYPVCMGHCAAIMRARKELSATSDPALAQAELNRLEAVCREATLAHLRRVAAVMPADQGLRFLALVAPKVSGQSHDAPLGLK